MCARAHARESERVSRREKERKSVSVRECCVRVITSVGVCDVHAHVHVQVRERERERATHTHTAKG